MDGEAEQCGLYTLINAVKRAETLKSFLLLLTLGANNLQEQEGHQNHIVIHFKCFNQESPALQYWKLLVLF